MTINIKKTESMLKNIRAQRNKESNIKKGLKEMIARIKRGEGS